MASVLQEDGAGAGDVAAGVRDTGPVSDHPAGSLSWLEGTWRGEGVGGYPTIESDFRFGQEITFAFDGRPVLAYRSHTWLLDEDRPSFRESGYWRPQPDGSVEVLLAYQNGFVAIYYGTVTGTRVDMSTDLLARSSSAKEVTAEHRLYGLVEGDLMYAADMAAVGQPLQPHTSARLQRVQ